MIVFALRKFAGFVATFLVAALIIFFALDLLPATPVLGSDTPGAADAPAWQRFFAALGGLFTGDLGLSASQGQPIGQLLGARLGVTLPLALIAMLLATLIGVAAGLFAAKRRGSLLDSALMVLVRIGVAVPNFWLGMLLVLLFATSLRWLPPGGFVPWGENALTALASLILPALALALPASAVLAQGTRRALVDVQQSSYLRSARASGLTGREAMTRHGYRNAALPVLAALARQSAHVVAGTIIVENVFYLPGLGRLIFDALNAHDLPLVRSGLLVLVLIMTGTTFLVRLSAGGADPRLRTRGAP